MDDKYKLQLQIESENIDPSFEHATRLISQELERVESGAPPTSSPTPETAGQPLLQVHIEKPVKMFAKIKIPVKDHPKFNFVGKLLGPQGNSLKRLQRDTGTKMSILGRGSMRDKAKEESCRQEGGKFAHLNDELHVLVEVNTEVADGYARISHALTELKKYLIPGNDDDIGESQRQEMMFINGGAPPGGPPPRGRGLGRGGPPPPPPGRGGVGGLLARPGGRGAVRQAGPGGFSSRGGARGNPRGMLGQGMSRGASRGASRGGMRPPARAPAPTPAETYMYDDYSGGYDDAYADQGYGDGYDQSYGAQSSDSQFFDYGHGSQAGSYDDGYGDSQWGTGQSKAPPARGRGQYRSHPYSGGPGVNY